jgi:hypothetical protein
MKAERDLLDYGRIARIEMLQIVHRGLEETEKGRSEHESRFFH